MLCIVHRVTCILLIRPKHCSLKLYCAGTETCFSSKFPCFPSRTLIYLLLLLNEESAAGMYTQREELLVSSAAAVGCRILGKSFFWSARCSQFAPLCTSMKHTQPVKERKTALRGPQPTTTDWSRSGLSPALCRYSLSPVQT